MAARTIKRTNSRNRSAMDPAVPRRMTPAVITNLTTQDEGTTLRVTFGCRVMARGVPAFTAGSGGSQSPSAITQESGTVVDLIFGASVAGSNLNVQEADPAIRTPTGGFVPAGTYQIPVMPT